MPNTWPAASAQRADVSAEIANAHTVDGDTVTIPAGTGTDWATNLTITKDITLQGNGIGSTLIQDDVSGVPLITWTVPAGGAQRMTGIEFFNGSRPAGSGPDVIRCDGPTGATTGDRTMRVDHCKFDHLSAFAVRYNRVYGLIDNNYMYFAGSRNPIYIYNNANAAYSDARWAEATNWGGSNFVFIEDNYIERDSAAGSYACLDAYGGARVVFRHNTTVNTFVGVHGTESAGRQRGTRAVECYINTFNHTGITNGGVPLCGLRSGTGLVWGNSATNWKSPGYAVNVENQRNDNDFVPWGPIDGFNPWDINDAGNPLFGPFTASSGTGRTVTKNLAGWTTDQFVGYNIRKTTAGGGFNIPITNVTVASPGVFTAAGHGFTNGATINIEGHLGSTPHVMGNYTVANATTDTFTIGVNISAVTSGGNSGYVSLGGTGNRMGSASISGNTDTVITFEPAFDSPSEDLSFTTNDTFQINLTTDAFDGAGRSGGTTLAGVALPTTTPNPYDQVDDPIYAWDNTSNLGDLVISVSNFLSLQVRDGEQYNDTEYVYTPYTYPHPLRDGDGGGSVVPPTPVRGHKRFKHFMGWILPLLGLGRYFT